MFEFVGGEQVYSGKIVTVRVDRFRHADGEEVTRERIVHPGAVAVFAHDGESFFMVCQPREAVGEEVLELPAGKLDEQGEDALATAQRELAEEIGKRAESWRHLTQFWSSVGFSDEQVDLYLATGLSDHSAESDEHERIEIQAIPLSELDATIADCRDAKSLIGLLWVRAFGLER